MRPVPVVFLRFALTLQLNFLVLDVSPIPCPSSGGSGEKGQNAVLDRIHNNSQVDSQKFTELTMQRSVNFHTFGWELA